MLFTTFNNRLIALAILIQLLRSNAQDTSNSNIDAASNGTNSTDRPADLPFVGWTILRIDPSSRENLCQRQIAYCTNTCGGPNNVSRNFCNATSVAWNCECSKKNADFATYLWPVVQAECTGKAQDCQMICNRDTMKPAVCSTACTAYYQCDNVNAPPSYLQTESPSDVPSYNGPKKVVTNTTNVSNNDTTSNHTNSSDTPSSDASAINYSNRSVMAYVFISMTLLVAGSTTFF